MCLRVKSLHKVEGNSNERYDSLIDNQQGFMYIHSAGVNGPQREAQQLSDSSAACSAGQHLFIYAVGYYRNFSSSFGCTLPNARTHARN